MKFVLATSSSLKELFFFAFQFGITEAISKAISLSKLLPASLLATSADSGYASYDNYEELEGQNKNVYIPDQQMNMEAEKAQNPYHRNHFVYNEKDDCFICPENKVAILQH